MINDMENLIVLISNVDCSLRIIWNADKNIGDHISHIFSFKGYATKYMEIRIIFYNVKKPENYETLGSCYI